MADMFAFQGDDAEEFGGNNGALAKISANSKRMYMDAVMMVFLFSDGLRVRFNMLMGILAHHYPWNIQYLDNTRLMIVQRLEAV